MNKSFIVIAITQNVITQKGTIEYEKGLKNYNNANDLYNSKLAYYEDLEKLSKEENGTIVEVSLCVYTQNDLSTDLNKIKTVKKQQYYLGNWEVLPEISKYIMLKSNNIGNDVYQEDK